TTGPAIHARRRHPQGHAPGVLQGGGSGGRRRALRARRRGGRRARRADGVRTLRRVDGGRSDERRSGDVLAAGGAARVTASVHRFGVSLITLLPLQEGWTWDSAESVSGSS